MPTIKLDTKGQMQFSSYDNDSWKKGIGRILNHGEPLSWKTTSLMTSRPPRHLLIFPGELGFSSIQEDSDTKIYVFEVEPKTDHSIMYSAVKKVTKEILTGKHGEVTTIGLDGLHVFLETTMRKYGWPGEGDFSESARGRGYDLSRRDFFDYLNEVLLSPTPYVLGTCYDGDKAVERGSNVTGVYPGLTGQVGKLIMGKFPITVHSKRVGIGTAQENVVWQLQVKDTIKGVGFHVPVHIKKALPPTCEPNYQTLERIILDAAEPQVKKLTA